MINFNFNGNYRIFSAAHDKHPKAMSDCSPVVLLLTSRPSGHVGVTNSILHAIIPI